MDEGKLLLALRTVRVGMKKILTLLFFHEKGIEHFEKNGVQKNNGIDKNADKTDVAAVNHHNGGFDWLWVFDNYI